MTEEDIKAFIDNDQDDSSFQLYSHSNAKINNKSNNIK
jgi:hypothetical protein